MFSKTEKDAIKITSFLIFICRDLLASQLHFDLFYRRTERFTRFHLIFDRFTCMQYSCVIFLSDNLTDVSGDSLASVSGLKRLSIFIIVGYLV